MECACHKLTEATLCVAILFAILAATVVSLVYLVSFFLNFRSSYLLAMSVTVDNLICGLRLFFSETQYNKQSLNLEAAVGYGRQFRPTVWGDGPHEALSMW